MTDLSIESITFGKYKGNTLKTVLKDRSYCEWLLLQDWFKNSYEYIYNRVKEYNPLLYFFNTIPKNKTSFLETYQYFNLIPVSDIKLELTDTEKKCYSFYLNSIQELKQKIYNRIEDGKENMFDIKAPNKWLQKFEQEHKIFCITRKDLKDFLEEVD